VQLCAQELRLLAEQGVDVGRRIWELADRARQLPAQLERANVLWTLTACLTARGDLVSTLPLLSEAEALFEQAGHTPRVAAVRADLAELLQHLHPPETALRASHAALAACRAAGNVVDECATLRSLGLASARVGDLDGGLRALSASEAIAAEIALPRLVVAARATAALVLLEHHDWAGALERMAAVLDRPRAERGSLEAALLGLEAAALFGLGRTDDAREAARRGLSERSGVGAPEIGEEVLFVAAHEAGLKGALDAGVGAVVACAERILDPDHRRRYLRGTPGRVRLLELAREAGMPVPD
jgi:tetratricopeptide (TPR) repeat protein